MLFALTNLTPKTTKMSVVFSSKIEYTFINGDRAEHKKRYKTMKAVCPTQDLAIPLLTLFGERYIFCDNEQAKLDAELARDSIADAFIAILQAIQCCMSGCNGECKTCDGQCERS